MSAHLWFMYAITMVLIVTSSAVNKTLQAEARKYLKYLDKVLCDNNHEERLLDWAYQTNVTSENLKKLNDFRDKGMDIKVIDYPWQEFDDPSMLRQAKLYGLLTPQQWYDDSMDTSTEMNDVITEMIFKYSNEKICLYTNQSICDLTIEDINSYMASSTDVEELKYYWLTTMNKLGADIKPLYTKYVKLGNKLARYFNYSDKADQMMDEYEGPAVDKFRQVMEDLYKQVEPLYVQLFVYVRKRLYDVYGPEVIDRTGPIPIHLAGNLQGYDFSSITDIITPYPDKKRTDITKNMKEQNYTMERIARLCEDFYKSLGLPGMPASFWKNSQFEEPKDRISTCFTAAWDMYDNKDYRILACESVGSGAIYTLCHEMGHLEYALGYKNQPYAFKKAPNRAIDEGLADTAGLSVVSKERMGRLGLLDLPCDDDKEVDINEFFENALFKVTFLPYALIVDRWRWMYFKNEINDDNCNTEWWNMRLEYQGVVAPEIRSDNYIDPVIQVQLVQDDQYIAYFIAEIVQYQLHESLCVAAGEYDPFDPQSLTLDKCDIYGSKKAGRLLKNMFSRGASKPWTYAVEAVTGQKDISAEPILKYFQTLYDWLVAENEKTNEYIGW